MVISPLLVHKSKAQSIARGLSWNFYNSSCPQLVPIIRNQLRIVFRNDPTLPAAVLRLHFHDCFVQGCDGSVLLDGSASGPGEKNAPPNLTLRPEAFATIEALRRRVHQVCGQVVSCTDIVALAARESVFLSGGSNYRVPLGRRDGTNFATIDQVLNDLPFPQANVSSLIPFFLSRNLSITDMVTLSGAHSIGVSNCSSFRERLYPNQDFTMDQTFATTLRRICPTNTSTRGTNLDVLTPRLFDNRYFVNLVNRRGLLTSDQDLFTDARTSPIVTTYARRPLFFLEQFGLAMIKMGQINVLTGTVGEIRANCAARNARTATSTMLEVDGRRTGDSNILIPSTDNPQLWVGAT
ncbi:hypothetical protein Syun_013745 [Stephania yunnanensis]|uniref:Peroxidase n=1 Tax=Stephania yunnanensis TaxID=152371 RepID=A0AAP0JK28_9MAGN